MTCIKVLMIIAGSRINRECIDHQVISFVDLAPTILDLLISKNQNGIMVATFSPITRKRKYVFASVIVLTKL